jgi:hypothetical protein
VKHGQKREGTGCSIPVPSTLQLAMASVNLAYYLREESAIEKGLLVLHHLLGMLDYQFAH